MVAVDVGRLPLLQGTLAAHLSGRAGHPGLRLLQGVMVGILVGESALAVLGAGYGSLGLAVFVAMAIARALGGARVTLAQAAVGAILVVSSGNVTSDHNASSTR